MTTRAPSSKTSIGMMALLFIVLVDTGLGVWLWYRRQVNQENYSFTASKLPPVEPSETPEMAYQPPTSGPNLQVPNRPQATASRKPSGPTDRGSAQTQAATVARSGNQGQAPLVQAAAAFISMQREPKFYKSRVVRQWRHDFLSYPDLKGVNDRYWKDRNVLGFVLGTLRSPNFVRLIAGYAANGDIQAFAHELMGRSDIMAGARQLVENPQVVSAAKNIAFPGLPPIGSLMKTGAVENMQQDPNVGQFIQQQAAPVPLQQN